MRAGVGGLKLKDALSILHRIIAGYTEEFIAQKREPFWIICRHPLFAPRAILPHLNDKRLVHENLSTIRGVQCRVVVGTRSVHSYSVPERAR